MRRCADKHFSGLAGVTQGNADKNKDLAALLNQVRMGVHTVTSAEDAAGTLDIVTGHANAQVVVVQLRDSSGATKTGDIVVTESAGTITVADGSGTALTATDVIHWYAATTLGTVA